MITREMQSKILEALAVRRESWGQSDGKFAVSLGINPAQYSRIKRGDTDRVLSDAQWISLARRMEVSLTNAPEWKTAATPVYRYITAQLEDCQNNAISIMLCDLSDIGKSYVARKYCNSHKNAVYVDCSIHKTRSKMIRYIAKSLGAGYTGRYADVFDDLVFYIKSLPAPLIVLDEAGDLVQEAFLELKALWNATELSCGFYMMGADGLRAKIERSINYKKVGYTEIFSRFGRRYMQAVPITKDERDKMLQTSAAMIINANAPEGTDVNVLLRKCIGDDGVPSLRRIYKELQKK